MRKTRAKQTLDTISLSSTKGEKYKQHDVVINYIAQVHRIIVILMYFYNRMPIVVLYKKTNGNNFLLNFCCCRKVKKFSKAFNGCQVID